MFLPGESFPLAGGALLAGALYAGISFFVTGPMIGERMIERLEWGGQCARHIDAEIAAAEPPIPVVPGLDCHSTIGIFFGRDGQTFCAVHGQAFDDNPITRSIEAAEDIKRDAMKKRMSFAAERASSRCECAMTTTLEDRRVAFGLYAGSGRLIAPSSIGRLESDLVTALNTPACAMKG